MDLVVGSRDQTAKVYFNDGTGAPYYCLTLTLTLALTLSAPARPVTAPSS